VLGVIKAMGALDQSPKLLGGFIGAALVGTFAGIFLSYGIISPFALKIKMTREKRCRPYIIVKQTLLAFMNGRHAADRRRTRPQDDRQQPSGPSIDVVENETIAGPKAVVTEAEPKLHAHDDGRPRRRSAEAATELPAGCGPASRSSVCRCSM